jgi:hypothetical protein
VGWGARLDGSPPINPERERRWSRCRPDEPATWWLAGGFQLITSPIRVLIAIERWWRAHNLDREERHGFRPSVWRQYQNITDCARINTIIGSSGDRNRPGGSLKMKPRAARSYSRRGAIAAERHRWLALRGYLASVPCDPLT